MFDKEILDELKIRFDKIAEKISKNGGISIESKEEWQEREAQVERKFDMFGSDKFFVVATGMLKAGKSTLVNLLARNENASPIGFGVDTTLRPALIRMQEEGDSGAGKIRVYFPRSSRDFESAQIQLQKILDEIRSLNADSRCDSEEFPLNQQNLQKILCSRSGTNNVLPVEPLLVLVELPFSRESKIFSESGCVIFDMPGLDSEDALVARKFEAYNAIFRECDMVLFVQSNVSPLNDKACGYLREIGSTRHECTYRLVQNKMNARYWRQESAIDEELQDQARKGRANFLKKIGSPSLGEDSLIFWTANLGMAYDSIFKKNLLMERDPADVEKLRNDSEFLVLERKLCEDIEKNGEFQRMNHRKDELSLEFKNVLSFLQMKIGKIDEEKSESVEKIANLTKDLNEILNISRKSVNFSGIKFTLSEDLRKKIQETFLSDFKKIRLNEFSREIPRTDSLKIRGSDFNRFLNECDGLAREKIGEILKDSLLKDVRCAESDVVSLLNKMIEEINDVHLDLLKVPIPQINRGGQKIDFDFGKFSKAGEVSDKIFVSEKRFLLFEKKIETDSRDISERYRRIFDHYEAESECAFNSEGGIREIAGSLLKSHVESFVRDRQNDLNARIDELNEKISDLDFERKVFSEAAASIKILSQDVRGLPV